MDQSNLNDALFWFSFSVILDNEESISLVKNRIENGIIDNKKLQAEFTQLLSDNNLNWIEFVINYDIISKFQAENMGNQKCKEYVVAIINNFITYDKQSQEE